MKSVNSKITTYALIVLSVAGCQKDMSPNVSVGSLRENLPKLEQAAKSWRQDAYLARGEIELLDGHPSDWIATAFFQSPNEDNESLIVYLEIDGDVSSEIVPHTAPVRRVEPISAEDWRIDSPEAFELALNAEGRRFLEEHAELHCSFIALERDIGEPGEPVIWRLVISECLGGESLPDVYLDPISGEVLAHQ